MYDELLKAEGEKQFSHRNDVYVVEYGGEKFVRKTYRQKDVAGIELSALQRLSRNGVRVPDVLLFTGDDIILEHIGGRTYEAVLRDFESGEMPEEEVKSAAEALVNWLFAYYKAEGRLRGDINFRNFIYTGSVCVGVDFEELTEIAPFEDDMGRMITYAATYKPACSEKKRWFCGFLIERFLERGANKRLIYRYAVEEIAAMCNRRESFKENALKVRAFVDEVFGLAVNFNRR